MALGVLNNLSAIYAENNLNNTSGSLQTVLQQLSSGSKINSGADDAAGLSLVNGLAANTAALTQSETNATEGVGLLQVADGALSQVTSLLNRAITLATEASNGTLNSTQEGAANAEYTSILSLINNIGKTTTFNQQTVFSGITTAIYTGDSSTTGSSIDELNIRALSEASVGDTGGAMSYSSGQSSVFIDLTANGQQASINDSLTNGNTGTSSITVNALTPGSTTATATTLSVSNGDNTVQGLITRINQSGLGLTAKFTTAAAAGSGDTGTDTGIEITASQIGAGATPGQIATVSAVPALSTLGGSISIEAANGKTYTFGPSGPGAEVDMNAVMTAINNAKIGVTASVTAGVLTLDATSNLTVVSSLTSDLGGVATALTYTPTTFYSTGISGTIGDANTTAAGVSASADAAGGGGTATTSYTDGAGEALNATDLLTQSDAEASLNDLNVAISDVAAQDGYIGAQINTLNSISQVMSTQQENVVSAQNAIQATDYASATSNMSKYEILSQTGIAALAQANSVQQEVTKLLQ
jgi:flagellin